MPSAIPRTCIYCNQERPFTDEHVFPAGLGGDDRRFLLKDLVCGHCNTEVFSKMEARFMRASPVAIARIFLQPRGRGKGKNASIPTIDTRTTTIVFADQGPVEAEVLAGGKPVTLMQLLFLGDGRVGFTGGDHENVANFIDTLEQTIGDELFLVQKEIREETNVYRVETLVWEQNSYRAVACETVAKPPKYCLWREPLDPGPKNEKTIRPSTLYQRTAGQIVLRLPVGEDPTPLIAEARKAIEKLKESDFPGYTSVENPLVHVSMAIQLDDYERVLAKIGLNLVAYLFGESYIRHHAFNGTKRAILSGSSRILHQSCIEGEVFNAVPHDRHVMTIAFMKSRAGRFHVALLIRLYGTTSIVRLSSNALKPPIEVQMFFIVDYNSHQIEQFTSKQFAARYPPEIPDDYESAARYIPKEMMERLFAKLNSSRISTPVDRTV